MLNLAQFEDKKDCSMKQKKQRRYGFIRDKDNLRRKVIFWLLCHPEFSLLFSRIRCGAIIVLFFFYSKVFHYLANLRPGEVAAGLLPILLQACVRRTEEAGTLHV